MWGEIVRRYIAIFLIGVIIKILDDEIDQDFYHKGHFYLEIMKHRLPYCLLFMSMAMILDPFYSFGLFTSAYALGMFRKLNLMLPSQLKSYQELLLIIFINLLLIPVWIFLHSMIIIMIIQLMDDLMDCYYDRKYGFPNLVNSFGKVEVSITILILVVISFMMSWINTLIIIPVAILINYLYSSL
ncbi:hypothetical protein Amet_2538 [Alkaliphilus metalliredigens QYMF]|uniref:UbiA prenyltransferase n=1 Tax=Alkaliphilus metalliredigens (strain QYMF) TaxID=293826 RepID=A6TR73_ALKMQ|nr:hypothetical protein [Alkaliphilus metalliredigens]ABR48691.1 hypothetical protein Amet_2538 [Alkaliphilus metalliredigens QYMF]